MTDASLPTLVPAPVDVSVVVPCQNEEQNLEPLILEINRALEPLGRTYEIILVDDGSTDDSWKVMESLCKKNAHLRALHFASRCGQSAALWAGLRQSRGQVIVTLDADLQNPPAEIPRLLAALENCDCVCGTRVRSRSNGDNLIRRVSSRIANSIRSRIIQDGISDSGCCFRAFKRHCIEHACFFRGAHRFLPALMQMKGFRVVEIPVSHRHRTAGRTHYDLWNRLGTTLIDLMGVRWMQSRTLKYQISKEAGTRTERNDHD